MTETVSSPTGTAAAASEPPPSLLTHIALPVRSLDDTLAFYEKFTTLVKISERHDPETRMRTAWLANERDITTPGAARFVIVIMEGALPKHITGDIVEEYGFLTSIAHLGISLNSRAEVDEVARAGRRGRLPGARPYVSQPRGGLHLPDQGSRRQQRRVLGGAGPGLTRLRTGLGAVSGLL